MSKEREATLLSLGFSNRCFTSGGELKVHRLKVQAEGPERASFGLVLHLRTQDGGDRGRHNLSKIKSSIASIIDRR